MLVRCFYHQLWIHIYPTYVAFHSVFCPIDQFDATGLFLSPWKPLVFWCFQAYRKKPVALNRLTGNRKHKKSFMKLHITYICCLVLVKNFYYNKSLSKIFIFTPLYFGSINVMKPFLWLSFPFLPLTIFKENPPS